MAGPIKRTPWKKRIELAQMVGPSPPALYGTVLIPRANIRAGILGETIWPKVFEENSEIWKRLGGCEITPKTPACPSSSLFNYFPYAQDAVLEYPEAEGVHNHTIAVDATKEPIEKRFPYLRRTQIKLRPTLLMFEVSGHVMLGVYFGNKKRPELHILNPWSIHGTQQERDVFTLQESAKARIAVVDVVGRVEEQYGTEIDLQSGEKIGYCTLWVGILASEVIKRMRDINAAVLGDKGTIAPGIGALEIYKEIYSGLAAKKAGIEAQVKARLGPIFDCTDMAAAMAVLQLATEAAAVAGKRRTLRKRKRSPHTRKTRPRKSWKRAAPHSM